MCLAGFVDGRLHCVVDAGDRGLPTLAGVEETGVEQAWAILSETRTILSVHTMGWKRSVNNNARGTTTSRAQSEKEHIDTRDHLSR